MMALQLQINPHFLFNTLQTVDMEVRKQGASPEEISTVIRCVSDILKYALSDPGEPVTVEEEIQYLKNTRPFRNSGSAISLSSTMRSMMR